MTYFLWLGCPRGCHSQVLCWWGKKLEVLWWISRNSQDQRDCFVWRRRNWRWHWVRRCWKFWWRERPWGGWNWQHLEKTAINLRHRLSKLSNLNWSLFNFDDICSVLLQPVGSSLKLLYHNLKQPCTLNTSKKETIFPENSPISSSLNHLLINVSEVNTVDFI